ncbi:phosphoglycerate dehydrogenase-like oxidoreductase [Pantoea sp. GM01]|nr:phosphoglycerate dehydrogenase-like oxidoreductase [Pantoea sp. GM01]
MNSSSSTLLLNFIQRGELAEWQAYFDREVPGIQLALWDDATVDPSAVHYALLWRPEPGRLAQYPNLRVIISEGAGVDHITCDPLVPAHIPLTRMVTDETSDRMADYVTMAAYMLVRQMPQIIAAQRQQCWSNQLRGGMASQTRVGILGMGNLGTVVAQRLLANGFKVNGWSRSVRQLDGVNAFHGYSALPAFLGHSDVLVNLLPDTPLTRNLINDEILNQLPVGASVINAGRGNQLDSEALLRALDSGHLCSAILDVFPQEPLTPDDRLWRHPGIIITSHVASLISSRSKAEHAIAVIKADRAGQPIPLLYIRERGY